MDMTMIWIFVACLAFFIIGIVGANCHYRRVKSWDKRPTTEEYMECLLIGWCSWMIIALAGASTLFVGFGLVVSILDKYF